MEGRKDPGRALAEGHWVKLICGASYQDLPAIRNLALVYTLAGVTCIDVAADPAVVEAAQEGINTARMLEGLGGKRLSQGPWLMVSVNDGEDPHFRKAFFDPLQCPPDCPQPCRRVCPTSAIAPLASHQGVIEEKCYGCGRCLPLCPLGLIEAQAYTVPVATLLPWLQHKGISAVEIHTQVGHFAPFQQVWHDLIPLLPHLQAIAVSCPYEPGSVAYLQELFKTLPPLDIPLIWQTDGRPMSGDIGRGTTHLCLQYAEELHQQNLPGYYQLAGGTNGYTLAKVQETHLAVQGVAFGGYARTLIRPWLEEADRRQGQSLGPMRLETYPDLLQGAIAVAEALVHPWLDRD